MEGSPTATAGSDVVICYCDSDADFYKTISPALDSLREERVISGWREQRVSAEDVDDLPSSDTFQVVIPLLSPAFLATGFMNRDDFLTRVDDQTMTGATVIPVLVRPVEETQRTLKGNIPAPIDSRPLCDVEDVAQAVQRIMARIRDVSKTWSSDRHTAGNMDRTIVLAPKESSEPVVVKPLIEQPAPPKKGSPEKIGRYKVTGVLGEGAFGAVYLAQDEQLGRQVAIKTPHTRRVNRPSDIASYMKEARVVAQLDHPGIVPVYDVGQSDEGQFFVVSKVIEGKDLSKRLTTARPSLIEAARLVALVAEALHYAHQRDLVHRDVKPANILIGDSDGRPFVADFGLAIHEDEIGQGPTRAGTPAYMSPEQARGEGHRVDGRSDVFSLGVVLYELITGRLPFRKQNIEELLAQIAQSEARPPRQLDASIPRELERICLKAMSNRIMDRYTTAQDFADDLWYFINSGPAVQSSGFLTGVENNPQSSGGSGWNPSGSAVLSSGGMDRMRRSSSHGARDSMTSSRRGGSPTESATRQSGASRISGSGVAAGAMASGSMGAVEAGPAKVVAKGLRAFDDQDADFFLELVPGPRDRHGLPDSLRFWKSRLEDLNAEQTFPVGVIYGPSGCGKTSLIRAGLLPRLSPHVNVVFLDATARDTETRLAAKIKNLCPDASPDADLAALVAWIRRGRGIPFENKLVIVIDQFEQWLQAHENDKGAELLAALRQCDGARVQCLLMVRVDFMMSIHRFMNDLEVPIREGANSAAVDLFDALHAQKVLKLFGASYGRLPEEPAPIDAASQTFVDQVVAELGPEGKIVPVQLALFADMCKGREWRPETLKAVGGARGIGVKFLEETFESSTAPLEHRVHEKACRAVLKSMLPELTNIRGQARGANELAQLAGYQPRSREFEALLGVLDRDTRLITPVEQEPSDEPPISENGAPKTEQNRYQLTHDYLVPSLREWLTKKQRETRRGRAQLRLDEFSRLWNDRPVPKRLPGPVEWVSMRTLTRPAEWTTPQRKMMKAAGRRLGIMSASVAAALVAMVLVGREVGQRFEAQRLASTVAKLNTAETASVPAIIAELKPKRAAAAPLLLAGRADKSASPQRRLNTALAALSLESGGDETNQLIDDVYAAMLRATPEDVAVIVDSVKQYSDPIAKRAKEELAGADEWTAHVLPLASVMAAYQPDDEWKREASEAVAVQLVKAPADSIGGWTRQLRPARGQLVQPLHVVFTDQRRPVAQRGVAGDLLVAFAPTDKEERVKKLVDLAVDATSPEQFKRIMEQLAPMAARAGEVMTARLADLTKEAADKVGVQREAIGRQQMHLAAGIIQLNLLPDAWKVFQHSEDPTVRSLLVEHLHELGIDPAKIVERLKIETDLSIHRALLLSLGGYEKGQLEPLKPAEFAKEVQKMGQEADAGLHAAANWLLDQWTSKKVIEAVGKVEPRSEKTALAEKSPTPTWYSTSERHDMVVFRGPLQFQMGAHPQDPDREGGALDETEFRHAARIPRSFAMSTKEVTVDQFLAAWAELKDRKEFQVLDDEGKPVTVTAFDYRQDKAPELSCPINNVDWFKAAAYCNWLSAREGIPEDQWVYDPKDEKPFQHQMVLPNEYLKRTGYRLPTEAEWEYACRSGATSGRFFGESPSLLPSYGWYIANGQRKSWPVGRLKPNEFGLFDVYGNVSEWCIDAPRVYSEQAYEDVSGTGMARLIDAEKLRAQRGGAFQYVPEMVTSAGRDRADPDYAYFSLGFRIARTVPD